MRAERGFTLVEVLVAMAITALVGVIGFRTLDTVITGVESSRQTADRLQDLQRGMDILSRDLHLLVKRDVTDEFGATESALIGGPLAREPLMLTRSGWPNTIDAPRSALERVAYRVEDDELVRLTFPVLDRVVSSEPRSTVMMEGVEALRIQFLPTIDQLQVNRDYSIDTRQWMENWIGDVSNPGQSVEPPAAVLIEMTLSDLGEVSRVFVLPPL